MTRSGARAALFAAGFLAACCLTTPVWATPDPSQPTPGTVLSVRETAMPAPAPLIDGSYAPGRQIPASARILDFTSRDEHGAPVTVGGIVLVP